MIKNLALSLFTFFTLSAFAQTGISVSPPRLYFSTNAGISSTKKVFVTNASVTNTLDLAVTLNDWEYDSTGENVIRAAGSLSNSCAAWISVGEKDKYFSLKPGEKKELDITITEPSIPTDSLTAHTALLFVTQMNPIDDVNQKGANIKISVRSGIKIFHESGNSKIKKVEISNLKFDTTSKKIALQFKNTGNHWCDGIIYTDLLNTDTGAKTQAAQIVFYSMPGNIRATQIALPEKLAKGKYVATIMMDYGVEDVLEMAELTFSYEQ